MSNLPNKRDFLASVTNPATGEPYAKAGVVGKFSNAANVYAEQHRDKWVAEVKVARPTVQGSTPSPAVDRTPVEKVGKEAPAIRAWALSQGIVVAARGRIHADVVEQYRAATGNRPQVVTVARPTPNDMPKRTNIRGLATANGLTHAQDLCGNRSCGRSLPQCQCEQGPQALGGVKGTLTLV